MYHKRKSGILTYKWYQWFTEDLTDCWKQGKSVEFYCHLLWQNCDIFLMGENQFCSQTMQMLLGRLGLEPRATWLKVPRCGQLRNNKDSIISYLNDQYFPWLTLVFLCFFLWVERNWNEIEIHHPPMGTPLPLLFEKTRQSWKKLNKNH